MTTCQRNVIDRFPRASVTERLGGSPLCAPLYSINDLFEPVEFLTLFEELRIRVLRTLYE